MLQQRVLLKYEVQNGNRCNLSILGARFQAQQFLGVSLAAAPPLTLQSGLELPFGTFTCLYNDGEIRVVKTQQGYLGVNRRMEAPDGWDA